MTSVSDSSNKGGISILPQIQRTIEDFKKEGITLDKISFDVVLEPFKKEGDKLVQYKKFEANLVILAYNGRIKTMEIVKPLQGYLKFLEQNADFATASFKVKVIGTRVLGGETETRTSTQEKAMEGYLTNSAWKKALFGTLEEAQDRKIQEPPTLKTLPKRLQGVLKDINVELGKNKTLASIKFDVKMYKRIEPTDEKTFNVERGGEIFKRTESVTGQFATFDCVIEEPNINELEKYGFDEAMAQISEFVDNDRAYGVLFTIQGTLEDGSKIFPQSAWAFHLCGEDIDDIKESLEKR